jgi:hypothetical protein
MRHAHPVSLPNLEPPIWSTAGLTTLIGADAQIWLI